MNKRYYHWIKLQRRYRATQQRWAENQDRYLKVKLDRIGRRMHRLNRSWQLGVSTAALTAWLMVMPGTTANAQVFAPTIDLSSGLDAADGFEIYGEVGGEASPVASVESVGDLNGDGIDDLVFGAPSTNNYAGTVYVVFGKQPTDGFGTNVKVDDLNGTNGFKISGENGSDRLGASLGVSGDLNGDGVNDLAISATNAQNRTGVTYVIFGKKQTDTFSAEIALSSLDEADGFKVVGENPDDFSGGSLSTAGDLNADGINDLVIGAYKVDIDSKTDVGKTYVVFGKAQTESFGSELSLSSLNGTNGFSLIGEAEFGQSGRSLSTAGDLNNDGIHDLVVGVPGDNVTYVVFGKEQSDTFGAEVALTSLNGIDGFGVVSDDNGRLGGAVSIAGDLNGDGIDDLVIGASGTSVDGKIAVGKVHVLFGKEETDPFGTEVALADLNGTNGFSLIGEEVQGSETGKSVNTAGDINGDGVNDLVIMSFRDTPRGINHAGTTYVVFGKRRGDSFNTEIVLPNLDGTDGFRVLGKGDTSFGTRRTVGVLDMNGDGFDDLFIGGYLADVDAFEHEDAHVLFGRKQPVAPIVLNALLDEQRVQEGNEFGYEVPNGTFSDPNPTDSFTLSASLSDGSPLPAWLTFDAATGTFSGTPERSDAATLTVRVTATDDDGLTGSDEFVLTVNDLPVLANLTDQSVNSEELLTFTSTADNQIGTLAFSLDAASTSKGMTIDGASGAFNWTPTANDAGAHEVTVSVSDGEASDEKTFMITVIAPLGVSSSITTVAAYPNPTNGVLKVEGLTGIHQAIVYSLSGKQILIQEEVTNGRLDIGQLNAGTYLITFGKDGNVRSQATVIKIN